MDFHVLQMEVEIMMDLIGNRRRIWVTISTGRESQLTLALSDIAACFQREREREIRRRRFREEEVVECGVWSGE